MYRSCMRVRNVNASRLTNRRRDREDERLVGAALRSHDARARGRTTTPTRKRSMPRCSAVIPAIDMTLSPDRVVPPEAEPAPEVERVRARDRVDRCGVLVEADELDRAEAERRAPRRPRGRARARRSTTMLSAPSTSSERRAPMQVAAVERVEHHRQDEARLRLHRDRDCEEQEGADVSLQRDAGPVKSSSSDASTNIAGTDVHLAPARAERDDGRVEEHDAATTVRTGQPLAHRRGRESRRERSGDPGERRGRRTIAGSFSSR